MAHRNDRSLSVLAAFANHRGFHTDGSCPEGVVAGLGSRYLDHPKSDASGTEMPKSKGKIVSSSSSALVSGAPPR